MFGYYLYVLKNFNYKNNLFYILLKSLFPFKLLFLY